MTCIYDNTKETFSSDFFPYLVEISIKFIINDVICTLIFTFAVNFLCVIRNDCFVPTIFFITALVIKWLTVTRKVNINQIAWFA